EKVDFVIANGENASTGMGMTPAAYRQLREAGIDLLTLGDHAYKKQDIIEVLQKDEHICKPANFPPEAPGREYAIGTAKDGTPVAVISLLGRAYMRPIDCPFHAVDRVLKQLEGKAKIVFVDM